MTIEVRNESGEILNGAELAQRNLVTWTERSGAKVANTKWAYMTGLRYRLAK